MPDAGLYEYQSASAPQPFPTYFSGTRAHNTVVVDGQDQGKGDQLVVGGAVLEGPQWRYQSGRHTLYQGVVHRRSVMVLERDVSLVIDSLESDAPHDYVQTWHFAPASTIDRRGLDLVAKDAFMQPELAVHQAVVDGVSLDLVKGQETPVIQGFYSDKYGHKFANYAAEYHQGSTRAAFATLLTSGSYVVKPTVFHASIDPQTGYVNATVCVDDAKLDVAIVNQAADGEAVTVQQSTDCP